jgi:hypothetical protein
MKPSTRAALMAGFFLIFVGWFTHSAMYGVGAWPPLIAGILAVAEFFLGIHWLREYSRRWARELVDGAFERAFERTTTELREKDGGP